ncbi:DUF983 domain-containing protein [Aquibium sp. A9E412]|uniref:DUF983 domain-containing protein n=1 Tax=Aquibium sp. A9E412 TaxID=2976767 RepID=UPI0025B0C42F|nr:DUF983 domain-containing protein [Aquibium sp. A9E412]MDN2564746.1 DUF983 domain-containing protein [Aquibium sp. A9E412]
MSEHTFGGQAASARPQRPLVPAMRRGAAGRCPRCGEGRLFGRFLKSVESCDACGETIGHHRADDLPAYLVIFIVGHIVVAAFMGVEAATDWSSWLHLALWVPLTVALSVALIQPVKGAVIGLQWALYMHGFGGEHAALETHPEQ